MSKRRLAVLISMLFAVPAAVVLAQSATTAESTEPAQEQQAAAEPATPAIPEVAVVTETTVVEQTTVIVPVAAAPAPVARIQQATWSDTFPAGTYGDEWNVKARHAAYVAQSEQSRVMMAFGSSFPAGTNGDEAGSYQPLPRQVAYFNRLEQSRIASLQPQEPIVRSEVQARSAEESAQAGSAELAMSSVR